MRDTDKPLRKRPREVKHPKSSLKSISSSAGPSPSAQRVEFEAFNQRIQDLPTKLSHEVFQNTLRATLASRYMRFRPPEESECPSWVARPASAKERSSIAHVVCIYAVVYNPPLALHLHRSLHKEFAAS